MRFRSLGSMLLLFAATFGLVVTASADSIIFLGLRYTALGSAKLQLVNGALVVSNIGPSGSDGVLIALPSNTTLFDLEISPLGSASSMSLGSFLRQTSFEVGSSQPVWIVQSTDIGNAVATGFTVLPPWPSLTADYFLGGVLVGTEQIANGALFYTQDQETTHKSDYECCPEMHSGGLDGSVAFALDTPNGSTFFVDDVEVYGPATAFRGFSSVSMTAGGGITTFTIVGAQLRPPLACSVCSVSTIRSGGRHLFLATNDMYRYQLPTTSIFTGEPAEGRGGQEAATAVLESLATGYLSWPPERVFAGPSVDPPGRQ